MTEQEIRAVFDELRRIGVDLERPPGLALGTGFRQGEFLSWLGTLPDALGHDAFVERLNAHIAAAAPAAPTAARDGSATPRSSAPQSFFAHPTLEQLEAAIDVLTQEWDPLGARLGALTRDDVADAAFQALNGIIAYDSEFGDELRGRRGGELDLDEWLADTLGSVEEHAFGVRPSPKEQRRYLGRRLMQVANEHPAPVYPVHPQEVAPAGAGHVSAQAVRLGPRGDEPPPLDPHAVCSQCGTTGTVAFVMRDVEPRLSRYCADCWRGVRHEYLSHKPPPLDTDTPAGTIAALEYIEGMMRRRHRCAGSALWEDSLEFVRAAMAPAGGESPANHAKQAARLARQILVQAPKMAGPMPPEIEAFVREYGPPAT